MTPEEYVKKHLKKPEISNLRGTAFGWGSNMKIYNLKGGPVFGVLGKDIWRFN